MLGLILIQELVAFLYADKKAVTKLTGRKYLIHNNDKSKIPSHKKYSSIWKYFFNAIKVCEKVQVNKKTCNVWFWKNDSFLNLPMKLLLL